MTKRNVAREYVEEFISLEDCLKYADLYEVYFETDKAPKELDDLVTKLIDYSDLKLEQNVTPLIRGLAAKAISAECWRKLALDKMED